MDHITSFLVSANWKGDSYDSILVIVDRLIKMVYTIPVKVMIDASSQAEVIDDIVLRHHRILESIMTDQSQLFISKFWSLLYYFLRIKKKLSTALHPQTNGQTERQNRMIEVYLRAFMN